METLEDKNSAEKIKENNDYMNIENHDYKVLKLTSHSPDLQAPMDYQTQYLMKRGSIQ